MKQKVGFSDLLKKTVAVIGASFSALLQQAEAAAPEPLAPPNKDSNIEAYQPSILRSRLVLKLNATNMNEGRVVMHTSHSSHSSHSSHASHYSSSSSYTPSVTPSYTPPPPIRTEKFPRIKVEKNYDGKDGFSKAPVLHKPSVHSIDPLHYYRLGSRTLFKGCKGTDVKELQQLLVALGYDLSADGHFDETTKTAVIDFQNTNNLTPDGRVGATTLTAIQNK